MKIGIFNHNFLNIVSKTGFVTNPVAISFRAIAEQKDTFESTKTYTEQEQAQKIYDIDNEIKAISPVSPDGERRICALRQEREEWIAKFNPNPNASIFTDKYLTYARKINSVEQHREFKYYSDDEPRYGDDIRRKLLGDPRYFVPNKIGRLHFLDTSWSMNKPNYERLNSDGVISHSNFAKKYNIDIKTLKRYIREGYMESITLKNHLTNEEDPVGMINENTELNQEGIQRHKKLKDMVSQTPYKPTQWIPITYFSRLGFGTPEAILEELKTTHKKGLYQIKNSENGSQTAYIQYGNSVTRDVLKYLRNHNDNIVGIEYFARMTHCDMSDIEDAMLSGEIKCVPTYVFLDDKDKVYIDLKIKANKEFRERRILEYELIRSEHKKQNAENTGLRSYIAWQLCPETKKVIAELRKEYPKMQEIFDILDEIKEYNKRKEKGEPQENEACPHLTKQQRILLKWFYKKVWEEAGQDEYKNATIRSVAALKEYKSGGLDAITDDEIKGIMRTYLDEHQNVEAS